ncbi:MAG: hypothetical protein EOM00_08140 [Clostridia bacterium]|nr:hypothetical protein [Clostridia bacterium]
MTTGFYKYIIIIENIIKFDIKGDDFINSDFTKIIMNPIRQRIIQYLIIHGQGTTGEMKAELTDIPPASLYRHVKALFENNCIEVAEERKVRGTVEKTYRLVQNPIGEVTSQDISILFQTGLMSLMATFQAYFSNPDADPQKDLLSLSTSTLLLTDEEFMDMMQKIGSIFNEVIYNKAGEGRKERRITFISSPCEKEE